MYTQKIEFEKPVKFKKTKFKDIEDMINYFLKLKFGIELEEMTNEEIGLIQKMDSFKNFKSVIEWLKF